MASPYQIQMVQLTAYIIMSVTVHLAPLCYKFRIFHVHALHGTFMQCERVGRRVVTSGFVDCMLHTGNDGQSDN